MNEFNISVPNDCRVSTFIEPRIGTCFPDIVVIIWHEPTTKKWFPARKSLSISDLRLIHLLFSLGPVPSSRLEMYFKINPIHILERLQEAGVVYLKDELWTLKPLDEIFAIRKILAFEAKMKPSDEAFRQALVNIQNGDGSTITNQNLIITGQTLQIPCPGQGL